MRRLFYFYKSLSSIFFDDSCMVCNAELNLIDVHICKACAQDIELLTNERCPRCAHPYPRFTENNQCPHCFGRTLPYRKTHALLSMNKTTKSLIHSIKYHKHDWLLSLFHPLLSEHIPAMIRQKDLDLIVPVPLSWYSAYVRGFNQSLLISRLLSPLIDTPIKQPLLRAYAPQQSMLTRKERLTNLKQAFKIRNSQVIHNKRILLVDDVYTTGATVGECTRVLMDAGAQTVTIFTLIRSI